LIALRSPLGLPVLHLITFACMPSPIREYKESCVLKLWNFFVLLPQIKNSRSEPGSHPQGRSAAEEARSALTPRASVG